MITHRNSLGEKSAPRVRSWGVGAGPCEPGAGVRFASRDRRPCRWGHPSAVRPLPEAPTHQRVDDARDRAGSSPARRQGQLEVCVCGLCVCVLCVFFFAFGPFSRSLCISPPLPHAHRSIYIHTVASIDRARFPSMTTYLSSRGCLRRWVNIRCCPYLLDDPLTLKVLAAFRSRLSMPKHPRDRGTVLGMERPQTQLRAQPPSRSPRRPHGGGASGFRGRADDRAQTEGSSVGGGERRSRAPPGSGGNAYRGDERPSGAGGSGGDGGRSAVAAKAASVEGYAEGLGETPVSPTRETVSLAAADKGPQGGEASRREQRKNHAHAQSQSQSQSQSHAAPPAEAPASTTSAGKEPSPSPSPSASTASTAAAAMSSAAAADASAAPRPADALPLLPAGVGDLSLGQHRRRAGAQRRKAVGTTPRDSGDPTRGQGQGQGQGQLRSRDDRRLRDDEDDRGRGDGEEAVEVRRLGSRGRGCMRYSPGPCYNSCCGPPLWEELRLVWTAVGSVCGGGGAHLASLIPSPTLFAPGYAAYAATTPTTSPSSETSAGASIPSLSFIDLPEMKAFIWPVWVPTNSSLFPEPKRSFTPLMPFVRLLRWFRARSSLPDRTIPYLFPTQRL